MPEAVSIAELLLSRVDDHGLGLIEPNGTRWSWGQLVEDSARIAAAARPLLDWSNPPHVGVLLPNGKEYLDWLGAAALLGATIVGVNPTRRGEQLAADIRSVDCQMLVTNEEGAALLHGLQLGAATNNILQVDAPTYSELLHDVEPSDIDALIDEAAGIDPSTLLLLLFTSGTTGTPKAVRCTQGRLATIARTAGANYGFSRDDICYCPMPLFHGNAIMALWAPDCGLEQLLLQRQSSRPVVGFVMCNAQRQPSSPMSARQFRISWQHHHRPVIESTALPWALAPKRRSPTEMPSPADLEFA